MNTPLRRPIELMLSLLLLTQAPASFANEAPDLGPSPSVADYQRYGLHHNALLRSGHEAWQAEQSQAQTEGVLPDPRISYGAFLQSVETRVGPQEHQLGVSQTLPWFGRLGHLENAGEFRAEASRWRWQEQRLWVRYEIARAVHALHLLERTTAITTENLDLLQQFEAIAQSRLRVGTAENADLLRLQLELGRLEDRVRQLRALRAPKAATLNALLNRAADAPTPAPTELDTRVQLTQADADLEARLRANHPALRALDAEASRHVELGEAARDTGRPNITIGVMHTFIGERPDQVLEDNGRDATLATVSLNLPIWRSGVGSRVQAAQGRRSSTLAQHRQLENQLISQLHTTLFEIDDAMRRIELYEDTLVPKAHESLRSTLTSYENGRSDFQALIESERMLLEFQLALVEAEVDHANATARLDALIAEPLQDPSEEARR